MKHTHAIVCLLALLIATNLWWFYVTLDQGSSLKYAEIARTEDLRRNEILTVLLGAYVEGSDVQQLRDTIQRELPSERPFLKDDGLHLPFVSFRLRGDGTVTAVE